MIFADVYTNKAERALPSCFMGAVSLIKRE